VINNVNVPDAAATVQQFVGNGVDVNITLSTLIYTPLPHWHGIDTLNVTVTDGKYFKRRSEHREWSTVVDIYMTFI
jgi:hypothetical protein